MINIQYLTHEDDFAEWRKKINEMIGTVRSVEEYPDMTNKSGYILSNNGTSVEWHSPQDILGDLGISSGDGSITQFADSVIIGDSKIVLSSEGDITADGDITAQGVITAIGGFKTGTGAFFEGNLKGNADTATKASLLSPGRKINGVTFDGSKDITIKDNTKLGTSGGSVTGNVILHKSLVVGGTSLKDKNNALEVYGPVAVDEDVTLAKGLSVGGNLSLPNKNSKIEVPSGTISASAVYNAVWNDYAEFFERAEETEVGDIIAMTPKDGKEAYGRATHKTKGHIVGVHSDSFGHLIGGEKPENGVDFVEYNLPKFIPVGLIGRVKTKIIGPVKTGDYIVLDERHAGTGRVFNELDRKSDIIGFAVESNDSEEVKLVRVKLSI